MLPCTHAHANAHMHACLKISNHACGQTGRNRACTHLTEMCAASCRPLAPPAHLAIPATGAMTGTDHVLLLLRTWPHLLPVP
mmetsp:Transcript_42320/g.126889  ORF Transcript_42320/g.126889 Transcript_42320/m.126889 type:complete len:82 (-) Transcript_42320:71-316(-)